MEMIGKFYYKKKDVIMITLCSINIDFFDGKYYHDNIKQEVKDV